MIPIYRSMLGDSLLHGRTHAQSQGGFWVRAHRLLCLSIQGGIVELTEVDFVFIIFLDFLVSLLSLWFLAV